MTSDQANTFGRELRRLALLPDGRGMSDGQLLACYLNNRDEAAFEMLVRRHGPMVLGVCRRVLRHQQDAEDAFQTTFLVFVRKAGSLRSPESLGSWLYGVAYRTAKKARGRGKVRRAVESRIEEIENLANSKHADQPSWDEVRALIDEEVNRLPDRYRVAIALCDLEGRSRKQTAEQLSLPEGTVSSRLARGREMLRRRLRRRGVAIGAGALGTLVAQNASAEVPASLVVSTTKAALGLAAGRAATAVVSPPVALLVKGVLRTMWLSKAKTVVGLGVIPLVACLGTGWVLYGGPHTEQPLKGTLSGRIAKSEVGRAAGSSPKPAESAVSDATAQSSTRPAKTEKNADQATAMKVVVTARQAYETAEALFREGRADEETVYRWSRRLLEAELAAAESPARKIAAREAHLARIKELQKTVESLFEIRRGSQLAVHAVKYYRSVAEAELDEAKSKP